MKIQKCEEYVQWAVSMTQVEQLETPMSEVEVLRREEGGSVSSRWMYEEIKNERRVCIHR